MYVHIYTHTHTIIKCEVLWVLKNVYTHLTYLAIHYPRKFLSASFLPLLSSRKSPF